MQITVVSIFPEMFSAIQNYGMTSRAIKKGKLDLHLVNLRDFTEDNYKRVDDRPYGGGPGMVMMVEPIYKAIESIKNCDLSNGQNSKKKINIVHLSPQGKKITQQDIQNLAEQEQETVFIASRYEGVDERVIDLVVDQQWSIGDYILSGGELAAMVIIDAISRLLPEVLGDEQSHKQDSFSDGLLDCPHYTRPENFKGLQVPKVLLSGNHSEINKWRLEAKLEKTKLHRPDLFEKVI